MKTSMNRIAGLAAIMAALVVSSAWGQARTEAKGPVEIGPPQAHQIVVHKLSLFDEMLGSAMVYDLDKQKFLGQVTTGFIAPASLSPDGKTLYTADAYFARGVRGERTDVITAWNMETLEVRFEVEIPPKRMVMLPERWGMSLSNDGRFAYVYNFTPASSISVVDLQEQKFVGEIPIAGCFLAYPTGDRTFAVLCGDGTLQDITIDDSGQAVERSRKRFFDPNKVEMYTRAARAGDMYYFLTVDGQIQPIDVSGDGIKVGERWSLFTDAQREAGWGVGGWQLMAIAPALDRLFVLVQPEWKRWKWEFPSTTVWAYDLNTHEKVAEYTAPAPIISLHATKDDDPLLVGGTVTGTLEVFDLGSGEHVSTMQAGNFPLMLYSR